MKDIEHHDVPGFPRSNIQKLGGMRSSPTIDIPLSFLCSNQENKKCVNLGNLCNPYSCVNTLVLIRSKMSTKPIEFKSSYVVAM
jgi:hypothetical protein